MATGRAEAPAAVPSAPRPFHVIRRRRETGDTWTLDLEPVAGEPITASPGQFAMLYAFGIGEAPISIAGAAGGRLVHTVRAVGAVTHAICGARRGGVLGVRAPLGNAWPVEEAGGDDVVVVAGGIGLAPLRAVIHGLLERRDDYGRVALLYGSRTPADLLYRRELERWRARGDLHVGVTVDRAGVDWEGRVGVVPQLIAGARLDPAATTAFVCGPETMMRLAAKALLDRGVPADRIHVSLERHMDCGVGHCGRCQLGPTLICRDGPVYRWDEVAALTAMREL